MSIEAAIGRIDQILTLQQQVRDPASLTSAGSATSGGASLTAGNGTTGSTDFASALASAQGQSTATSTLEAASSLDPAAAALGGGSMTTTGSTAGESSSLDLTGLLGSTGLVGSTALPGTTSGLATGGVATGLPSQVQAMTNEANSLVGKPYVWGGGHGGWGPQAGYDCSGFVSAVLHAGGYLSSPADTVTLPSQAGIEQGPGQYVTIYDRTGAGENGHVIIDINGQFYESGGESGAWGGGGGVEKIGTPSASYLATFNAVLHPAGL